MTVFEVKLNVYSLIDSLH